MRNQYNVGFFFLFALGIILNPGIASGQELVFKLSGQLGESYNLEDHYFGFKDGALTGVDPLDTPEPPLPPGSFLSMAFTMHDPEFPTISRWRDNFHNPADWEDGLETWEMVFSTDQSEQDCQVTFELVSGELAGMQVWLQKPGQSITQLAIPGEFTIDAAEMGEVIVLELRDNRHLITRISLGGLKSLFQ